MNTYFCELKWKKNQTTPLKKNKTDGKDFVNLEN